MTAADTPAPGWADDPDAPYFEHLHAVAQFLRPGITRAETLAGLRQADPADTLRIGAPVDPPGSCSVVHIGRDPAGHCYGCGAPVAADLATYCPTCGYAYPCQCPGRSYPVALLATLAELEWVAETDPSHPANAGRWSPSEIEPAYARRNEHLRVAAQCAATAGLPVGIDRDPADPHPVVLTIELPTGQATWHLPDPAPPFPPASRPWDGHTTAEKYARVSAWLASGPVPVRPLAAETPARCQLGDGCGYPRCWALRPGHGGRPGCQHWTGPDQPPGPVPRTSGG